MVLRAHPLKSEAVVLTTWRKVAPANAATPARHLPFGSRAVVNGYLGEMESGSEDRCERCGSTTGVSALDHSSGTSRLVCEQCDDLAQGIDPFFWRWFHYQGRFESEDSGTPTSTTSADTES
jgi:hypothetical protein